MLAAQHKLPAVFFERTVATDGGLISYGPDYIDQYRQAAGYVDHILKGEKPPTCRLRRRPSSSWCLTSRLPRRSASACRSHC
jgi:ABC-type uncharacterized transport system substrate-binding protein